MDYENYNGYKYLFNENENCHSSWRREHCCSEKHSQQTGTSSDFHDDYQMWLDCLSWHSCDQTPSRMILWQPDTRTEMTPLAGLSDGLMVQRHCSSLCLQVKLGGALRWHCHVSGLHHAIGHGGWNSSRTVFCQLDRRCKEECRQYSCVGTLNKCPSPEFHWYPRKWWKMPGDSDLCKPAISQLYWKVSSFSRPACFYQLDSSQTMFLSHWIFLQGAERMRDTQDEAWTHIDRNFLLDIDHPPVHTFSAPPDNLSYQTPGDFSLIHWTPKWCTYAHCCQISSQNYLSLTPSNPPYPVDKNADLLPRTLYSVMSRDCSYPEFHMSTAS